MYNQAVKEIQQNEYQKAHDLLNESIAIRETSDSYVNRAVCKLKLGDSDGYCDDLRKAFELNDDQAHLMYWQSCGRSDTSYVDSLGQRSIRSKSSYTRIIRTAFRLGYEEEMEYFSKTGESICQASINDMDTLFHTGTMIIAPVWKDKEAWMNGLIEALGEYLDTYHMRLNIDKDGSLSELDVKGLSKEGAYRVIEYFEQHQPIFEPATLWGQPIKLRAYQMIRSK